MGFVYFPNFKKKEGENVVIKITFPDGAVKRSFQRNYSKVAESISKSLAKSISR